jgi:putative N6-adenine-specific DNA methylase
MSPTSFDLFAIVSPGLEKVAADELSHVGVAGVRCVHGGVTFRETLAGAARVNLWSRTATRILLRVGAFDAPGRRELAARAARLPLEPFVAPGAAVRIQASSTRSRLYHTGLITEVLHEALGRPETKDKDAPLLSVRIERDRCTVSVDTSGELLHKRGYRTDVAPASLRETLAAGMLLLCRFDGAEPFLDPMCGAGTLAIEAGLIATGHAPGLDRRFALEDFPGFDGAVLDQLRTEARQKVTPQRCPIAASDIHAGALASARRNAARAGLHDIAFERADVSRRSTPAASGLLLANPPYGKRIGDAEGARSADAALEALGSALAGSLPLWRAGVLLPAKSRWKPARSVASEHTLDNGGIPVRLVQYGARSG